MVLHLQIRTIFHQMGAICQKMLISSLGSSLLDILYKMPLSCSWTSIPFTTKANYCTYAFVLGWKLLYNMKILPINSINQQLPMSEECAQNTYILWCNNSKCKPVNASTVVITAATYIFRNTNTKFFRNKCRYSIFFFLLVAIMTQVNHEGLE
jgi:hypothetical protein